MSLRILRRWSTPDIDALTISLSIYWVLLLPIVCSQRSRVSMYKGLLTHCLLCSKFVELTLITEWNDDCRCTIGDSVARRGSRLRIAFAHSVQRLGACFCLVAAGG